MSNVSVRATSAIASLILAALGLMTGCFWNRGQVGDELTPEAVETIHKGITTREEVAAKLGAPDRIVEANGHEIFHYYRYDIKNKGLFLIVLNFSRMNVKSDDLYVFINKNGVVDNVVFGRRTPNMEFQYWPFGK